MILSLVIQTLIAYISLSYLGFEKCIFPGYWKPESWKDPSLHSSLLPCGTEKYEKVDHQIKVKYTAWAGKK